MPEQHIDSFTRIDGIPLGAFWHIQREDGSWQDYKLRNSAMFGLDIRSKRVTYDIQTLLGGQNFENAPAVGNVHVPIKGYAVYTPGSITDGVEGYLIGQVNYESGGNKAAACRFLFNNTVQAAPLCSSIQALFVAGNVNWNFDLASGTTSNGTIEIWTAYAVVALP